MLEVRTTPLRYRYWALGKVLSLFMWFIFLSEYCQPFKFMSHENDMDLWGFSRRVEIGDVKYMKAGGEGEDRGWDGWVALPTWWTWPWVSSGSWWWTGKPGMLQSMGSQIIGHDWVTELKYMKPGVYCNTSKTSGDLVGMRCLIYISCFYCI